MAPRAPQQTCEIFVNGVLNENDVETVDGGLAVQPKRQANRRKISLVWRNIILFAYLHIAAVYGLWLMLTSATWSTGIFAMILYACSGLGITAGAHRLWAHRAYKAKWPLRVILMLFNTLAFQDAAMHWVSSQLYL